MAALDERKRTALGMDSRLVRVTIMAASVILRWETLHDTPASAAAAQSYLATQLANITSASAFFSTPAQPVTVMAIAAHPAHIGELQVVLQEIINSQARQLQLE